MHRSGLPAVLTALVAGAVLTLALVSGCAHAAAPGPHPGLPQRVDVHYARGTVQGGVGRVPVSLGSSVALVVSSDVADEVHLHGYDRKADVPAGGTTTIAFVADHAGVFEAELESRGAQLVQFEVR